MDEQRDVPRGGWLRRAQRNAVWIVACLPFLLAVASTRSRPVETPLQGTRTATGLAFTQYAVNLGELPAIGSLEAHFDFWNQSDQTVEIVKIVPSCGCLAPRLAHDEKIYPPGRRGSFRVSVRQANESPGPKSYSLRVVYQDDNGQHEQRLGFHCEIPERKVTVTPGELLFYQQGTLPVQRELRIEDHRGRNLQVLDVKLSSNLQGLVTATPGERSVQAGLPAIPIHVEVPGTVPPGRIMGRLLIETDDPDYREIGIPIWVYGMQSAVQMTSGIVPMPEKSSQPDALQKPETKTAEAEPRSTDDPADRETVVPRTEAASQAETLPRIRHRGADRR